MLINVVSQAKFKLGAGPSELNELLSVKATRSNYALTVYQGNVYVVLLVSFKQSIKNTLVVEERERQTKEKRQKRK